MAILNNTFNIGDEVIVSLTKETGIITDKMYSEAKGGYMYVIKPNGGGVVTLDWSKISSRSESKRSSRQR